MRKNWFGYGLLLIFTCWMTALADDQLHPPAISLEITTPSNGDVGEWRTIVTGRVSQPLADVWIVVRPLETRNFWIQPKPTIHKNGEWETRIYLGGKGVSHIGKVFDLRAVANPTDSLQEGLVLPGWPRAESKSNIVRIARK
ncbi:MAG: hypothetical protein NPIRA05_09080 [Nitrospirales bacterium]|nr:MAG: hypothetical protein NPIRA05_09080 [Nitrospirales bacterium]